MNLVQNESLNKQLVTAKDQLSKSDSRLKEVALKLAQVDENKVTLKKQVDLLSRKLKQKVTDNDQMGVELKSEQTNRVQLDEEVHALQLELRSVKNQLRAESDKNHNLQVKEVLLSLYNPSLVKFRSSGARKSKARWKTERK